MNLTAKVVAALKLPAGKADVIYFDDGMAGFGYRLRASAGGNVLRSWIVQYRRAGGSRRMTLGSAAVLSADKARQQARKVLGRVANGEDPQADRSDRRTKDAQSFRSVVAEYLEAKRSDVRRRTHVELSRYLTGGYTKALHGMPIDTITRKDIASRLIAITRESGSITAARARAALSGFFVWCMQMGLIEANPIIGTIQPKDSEGRSRVLSNAELVTIWKTVGDDAYGKVMRLLILTGCRRQEIGGMRWSELNEADGMWTLPAARAKNKHAHTLPLPPAAWQIINSVPRMVGRDHVFGVRAAVGFRDWSDAKDALDRRLGEQMTAPFVLHDVRRSVATGMADIGIQPHIIEQVLNHVGGHKGGVAGIYNRSSYAREVKIALATWADHVRTLVEGGERRVVSLPTSPATAS
jgi:integrase